MPVYCDPDRIDHYVFKADRKLPEAEQPRFGLGLPTVTERGQILSTMASVAQFDPDSQKVVGLKLDLRIADVVISAVWRSVENWKKADGTLVKFDADERGRPTERMLSTIAPGDLMEFMAACLRRCSLLPEDRD